MDDIVSSNNGKKEAVSKGQNILEFLGKVSEKIFK